MDEIDPHTYKIVREFPVGALPQHVIPSYDMRTLYVANDDGNSLTPINPATGVPGRPIPVEDPYNMYFTPDGRYAVVVEERMRALAFRNAQTMKLHHLLQVPQCAGVNHADFTADGRFMLLTCEFGGSMIVVDVQRERVIKAFPLRPRGFAAGREAIARRARVLRRRPRLRRRVGGVRSQLQRDRLRQDRRRRARAVPEPRGALPVRVRPQ